MLLDTLGSILAPLSAPPHLRPLMHSLICPSADAWVLYCEMILCTPVHIWSRALFLN